MSRAIPAIAFIALALAGRSTTARAQQKPTREEVCELAAKVIANSRDPRLLGPAYLAIGYCPQASASLASAWASPPSDSAAMFRLRRESSDISDRRIVDATLSVVSNNALPTSMRHAALDVVLAQYHPSVVLPNSAWANPQLVSLGSVSHYYQIPGAQPVTDTDRLRIVAAFRQMSTSDPDARWRLLAKHIAADLRVPK